MSEEKRKPGRPACGGAKNSSINVRVSRSLRERMDMIAAASGRTLAQEVEIRLVESIESLPYVLPSLDREAMLKIARVLKSSEVDEEEKYR